jgi:CRISPR-associated endonuclease/helicase Cas3
LDFGILALRSQIGTEASEFASPAPDAPVLMPAYIDLWSQTSPIPNADPEVALFLHGQDRSAATVQILWRADIDEHNDLRPAMQSSQERRRLIELFKLVPPRAAEAVEIPLWAARAWLEGSSADPSDFSDAVDRIPSTVTELEAGLPAFRWAWEDSERTGALHARALRGGDLIVIPAAYGGCDEWGWNPKSSTTVLDVADPAAWPYRGRRFAVRVTPTLIAQELRGGGSSDAEPATDAFLTTLAEHEGDGKAEDVLSAVLDLPVVRDPLRGRLERLQRAEPGQLHGAERRTGALDVNLAAYGHDSHERPRGVVFAALRGLRNVDKAQDEGALPATESEEQSLTADRAVTLVDHSEHVRAWASLFVQCAGLAPPTAEDVVLSAYLHDPGKADPRWQAYAFGGDPYGPTTPNEAIAKSGRLPPRGAWENAGLPPHWRHETLSVRLAIANPLFAGAHDPLLVIWLIGTHHGFGRPLFPHDDPLDQRDRKFRLPREIGADLALPAGAGPQSLAFDFRGWDWARVFEILKSRYGAWGLARLEAFVRLADHRASEAGMSPRPESTFEEAAE